MAMEPSESAKRRKVEVWYVKGPMIMQNSEYDAWILLEDQDSQVLVPPSFHEGSSHTGGSSSGSSSSTVEAQPEEGNGNHEPGPGSPENQ